MKLAEVILKERLPQLGTSSFKAPIWDLTFETGLVTIVNADRIETDKPWIVPLGNVIYMRPLDAPKKK